MPDLQDPYSCVLNVPVPLGFKAVPNSNALIEKTDVITITPPQICPAGYTEWEPNLCYINCPSNYSDNALTCVVQSVPRIYSAPTCGNLSYTPSMGSACILTPWGVTIYVLLILVAAALAFQLYTTKFGFGKSKILNKIQSHLRASTGSTAIQPQILLNVFLLLGIILALIFLRG